MDADSLSDSLKQIFSELFSELESLDTQCAALRLFLEGKGMATAEALAPFLEQAGDASNIRWLAVRVRTDALISSALSSPEERSATDSMQISGAEPSSEASAENQEKNQHGTASTVMDREDRADEDRTNEDRKNEDQSETGKADRIGEENAEELQQSVASTELQASPPRDGYSDTDLQNSTLSDPPFFSKAKDDTRPNTSNDSTPAEDKPSATEAKREAA